MRHFLRLLDPGPGTIDALLERTALHAKNRRLAVHALDGCNIGLLFEKASTRTRLSFQVAIAELGGNVINLDRSALQMGRGESMDDTLEVMARYLHALVMRTGRHDILVDLAGRNLLPIINGLTDQWHPCQILADAYTIACKVKGPVRLAFIGEGNNVFNSLAVAAHFLGWELRISSPAGYGVSSSLRALLPDLPIFETTDPIEAARGANVLYTDVWVSMGQENEKQEREKIFAPYQVDLPLLDVATADAIVMHCLPAYRGKEISSAVMSRFSPVIFDQAENRLHAQKAVLEWIFERI
ncbi:MAG: ornithine carbamoyltransferase [Spirochaetales bacterium]|nr:ornithine carbamoyltransferase [Spirochaetales bacterium]